MMRECFALYVGYLSRVSTAAWSGFFAGEGARFGPQAAASAVRFRNLTKLQRGRGESEHPSDSSCVRGAWSYAGQRWF